MRTTIRLDDALLARAKKLAAESGRTLTAVIEDALREAFGRRTAGQARKKVELATFCGKGIHPAVDLDDSAALLDLMDASRDPA